MICQSYFLVMLLINYQSFTNLEPMITNDLLIQFLCIIIANFLPIICQSALSFYYIPHIVAIATNYSNLLYQCFTNHYQSDPVLYISSLPMIINNLLIIITNHTIDKFLSIGSQCFTNHQFTNDTGIFTNSCQWFTICSYWQ